MKRAILIRYISLIVVALIIFTLISILGINYINRKAANDNIENYMLIILNELDHGMSYEEISDISYDNKNRIRITVIDPTGKVIADSQAEPSSMDNHYLREEIVSARQGKSNKYVRNSETLGVKMIYYAKQLDDDYYVRLAIPLNIINKYASGYYVLMGAMLFFVLTIMLFVSYKISDKMLVPIHSIRSYLRSINQGKLDTSVPVSDYSEVNEILREVGYISNSIIRTLKRYEFEKHKLMYVLENINQGILAVDKENRIVLMNHTAKTFLNINNSMIGKNIEYIFNKDELLYNIRITNREGGFKSLYYTLDGIIYYCSISTVGETSIMNDDISVIVLITDVTDIKNNEKIREEFFTNSSHELKTPLTAIKGFTELITQETSREDVLRYIEIINKNVNRMIALINDMINLSMIDNNIIREEMEKINLRTIIDDVKGDLFNKAQDNGIEIILSGEAIVKCYPNKTRELISNLIDNAVKYNKPNGKVYVTIIKDKDEIVLNVEDTGIGIEEKYHSRLFERFYRVDKGRSRKIGGTGLGLSIVKHICIIHNWELKLSSQIGKGTSIKIIMRK